MQRQTINLLTDGVSGAIFNLASAQSLAGDRQALNQHSRRASAIVIKSGAFFVRAPFNDGVDVDALGHVGCLLADSWRTTFTPSPLDRQASGDGFLDLVGDRHD